jgi:hypothetical protein
MGSHDLFGHFKHKLWLKEGLEVKLTVWLSTIKSQESPQFPCMQVASHIPLEFFWWGIQLCFRPHFNQRFAHKIMGLQSHESPNFENFGTPTWESLEKMSFGCWSRGQAQKYTIRGKVVVSPKFGPWWVLRVWSCPWLVPAPKVL